MLFLNLISCVGEFICVILSIYLSLSLLVKSEHLQCCYCALYSKLFLSLLLVFSLFTSLYVRPIWQKYLFIFRCFINIITNKNVIFSHFLLLVWARVKTASSPYTLFYKFRKHRYIFYAYYKYVSVIFCLYKHIVINKTNLQ